MAFSAERLIEEVCKREILYVSSLRTYKDTAMKEKAWEEVLAICPRKSENGEKLPQCYGKSFGKCDRLAPIIVSSLLISTANLSAKSSNWDVDIRK